jgi:hypothetical protein
MRENEVMWPRSLVVYETLCPALDASVIEDKKAANRTIDFITAR